MVILLGPSLDLTPLDRPTIVSRYELVENEIFDCVAQVICPDLNTVQHPRQLGRQSILPGACEWRQTRRAEDDDAKEDL